MQHPTPGGPRPGGRGPGPGPGEELLQVSYKDAQGVPCVSRVPARAMTCFRDFRLHFGISARAAQRFVFKGECEDGSAPFQWNVVLEDQQPLPRFQGRIQAECRDFSD